MKRKQLVRTIAAQAVELNETRQRCDSYAKSFDKACNDLEAMATAGKAVQAELDKLRQARARERAQPMPQDSLKVEHYEAGEVTGYHRATPAEREVGDKTPLAFREAVREALGLDRFGIDSAVVAIHKLKADLEMRDGDLEDCQKELRVMRESRDSHKEDADLVRATVRHLESQAASYRDTISELRLNPKMRGALEQAFDDAAGPDRAGPPTVRVTDAREAARPRYEATNILKDGKVIGYGVYDHARNTWQNQWLVDKGHTFESAQSDAIAECERLSRKEPKQANRGGI